MKNKRIIEAWDKIEPDEVAKNHMLENVLKEFEPVVPLKRKRINRMKIVAPIVACLICVVVIGVTLLKTENITPNDPVSTAKEQVFSGFVLMAYAAEVEDTDLNRNDPEEAIPTVLTPKVKLLLVNYSLLMSSVPGLPFTFDFNESDCNSLKADNMKITVDKGELLTWNRETGIITKEGTSITSKTGNKLYWTPFMPLEGGETVEEAQITVTAMKEGKEIGRQIISITEVNNYYYATVGELELL